jgi:tetraacyldisaccharide 4'-kinase
MLKGAGERPVFLSRGYGGREHGPHLVAADRDRAVEVGDEPLLLARATPTLVCRDRRLGAETIARARPALGAIVMDDGLQNPTLAKDLSIGVVDERRGLGNGQVLPAGPLRAPLDFQLGLVDAILINHLEGTSDHGGGLLASCFSGPILRATTHAAGDVAWLAGARVVAFAGIGAPDRFFSLLHGLGAQLVATRAFADHHRFSVRELDDLKRCAGSNNAVLVTTEKDWVRLPEAMRALTRVLPIRLVLDEASEGCLDALLRRSLERRTMQS